MAKRSPGPPMRPEPTQDELRSIRDAGRWLLQKSAERQQAPAFVNYRTDPKSCAINVISPHFMDEGGEAELFRACASINPAFVNMVKQQLVNVLPQATVLADGARATNEGLAFVVGMQPEDEAQTTLAVQMYAVHVQAMEMSRRMAQATGEAFGMYAGLFVKLGRTYAAQSEAMTKLKGKGKQIVRVEHVHVYPGGQAIVGDVHAGGRRGGRQAESGPQPLEQSAAAANLAVSPSVALLSENASWDAMPVAGLER